MHRRGFTLVELTVVVVIIGMLAALMMVALVRVKTRSKLTRVSAELSEIATAVNQYVEDNNYQYPPDTTRAVPPGLERYLAGGTWPTSIWPNGVFDWDNWVVNGQQIYQVTYRLCDISDPIEDCSDPVLFPNFGRNSSIFYCISGACIPHENDPLVPGYCVNCKPKEVNY